LSSATLSGKLLGLLSFSSATTLARQLLRLLRLAPATTLTCAALSLRWRSHSLRSEALRQHHDRYRNKQLLLYQLCHYRLPFFPSALRFSYSHR
jgi:hypothetical protein